MSYHVGKQVIDTRTQATTIPGVQNWPRVMIADIHHKIPWLFRIQRFSLTSHRIPWHWKNIFFPDYSLTTSNPAYSANGKITMTLHNFRSRQFIKLQMESMCSAFSEICVPLDLKSGTCPSVPYHFWWSMWSLGIWWQDARERIWGLGHVHDMAESLWAKHLLHWTGVHIITAQVDVNWLLWYRYSISLKILPQLEPIFEAW